MKSITPMIRPSKSNFVVILVIVGTMLGGRVLGAEKPAGDYSFLYENLPFKMEKVRPPSFPDNQVNIKEFGAKQDGITSNTKAFAAAIAAVVKKGGGTVVIPEGLWLTGPIVLKSKVNLHAEKGALVLFTDDYDEYPLVENAYPGGMKWRTRSPISAENAEDIAITGEGIFDGNGTYWRPARKSYTPARTWNELTARGGVLVESNTVWYPTAGALEGRKIRVNTPSKLLTLSKQEAEEIKVSLRPVMVGLISCKRVLISGPTFQNPPAWTLHPLLCEDVTITDVKVLNETWAANADALDLESCKQVIVYNCTLDAGDDAITIKSGWNESGRKRGVPTENVIVSKCVVYSGHGGFVVGSEMSGGVRNIDVRHCTFIGTDNGLRFKSTRERGGVVENIYISDINMINMGLYAILYDLYYAERDGRNAGIQPVNDGTPQFKNIYMKNIVCKGASRAILLQGLPEMPLKNINLENVTIEANNGVVCSDVESITMKNVDIRAGSPGVMEISNGSKLDFDHCSFKGKEKQSIQVSGEKTEDVVFRNSTINLDMIKIDGKVKAGAVKAGR
jgi:polygalacturonase